MSAQPTTTARGTANATTLRKALCAVAREDATQSDSDREALLHLLQHDDDHARVTARKLGLALMQESPVADAVVWCGLPDCFQSRAQLVAWQLHLLPATNMRATTDQWLRAFKSALQLPSRM
jgi:hypothetical protein